MSTVNTPATGATASASANDVSARLASIFDQYQKHGAQICVAEENGLFAGSRAGKRSAIEQAIASVEEALAAKAPDKAEQALFNLQGAYYATLHSAGLGWRLVHVYGLLHVIGTFAGTYAAAEVATIFFTLGGKPDLALAFAGIGGATLQGLYYTIDKANQECLRRVWIVSALVGPFVGMLLAIFLYYAFAGGLAVFAEGAEESVNQNVLIWVGLFAGFKWKWAIDKLEGLSKKVGS